MRAFTGNEDPKELFEELHRLLDRVGVLLLEARNKHELAMEFIARILPDSPSADDLRAAINAYKAGRYHPLPKFNDSVRAGLCEVNPAPDAAAPATPSGKFGTVTITR